MLHINRHEKRYFEDFFFYFIRTDIGKSLPRLCTFILKENCKLLAQSAYMSFKLETMAEVFAHYCKLSLPETLFVTF